MYYGVTVNNFLTITFGGFDLRGTRVPSREAGGLSTVPRGIAQAVGANFALTVADAATIGPAENVKGGICGTGVRPQATRSL